MGRDEIAALLGIKPNSVRDTLRRYGITEQRGYDRAAVEAIAQPGARPGRGGRINRGATMTTDCLVPDGAPHQHPWLIDPTDTDLICHDCLERDGACECDEPDLVTLLESQSRIWRDRVAYAAELGLDPITLDPKGN